MAWLLKLLKPFAYVTVPLFTLKYVANALPSTRPYVRLLLYVSALGIISAEGMVIAVWMAVVGTRFNTKYYIARSFYYTCTQLLDFEIEVEGEEHLSVCPAVMVGNHQSFVDIVYLGRVFPKRASIMAKTSIKYLPLLGQWMAIAGTIFVDRAKDRRKATEHLAYVGQKMKEQHTSLWMFPEGTRSMREHDDLLPFKKGAFHLAVEHGLPIIPVVCENYWRLYHKGVFEGGKLKVKVLEPIPTTGLTADDVTELSVRTRELMLKALREISSGTSEQKTERVAAPLQRVATPVIRLEPPTPADAAPSASISYAGTEREDAESARRRKISATSSRENGGETEDEGWTKVVGSNA